MRIAFLGTPTVAARTLHKLAAAGHDIPLVITQPDKRRSRRGEPEPTPVKAAAFDLGLRTSDQLADLSEVNADVVVVAAFGKLIPAHHLDRFTFVNIHPSLLPRWRGAAPVQHTILAGDGVAGVCVMRLVQRMDEGPVYVRRETAVGERETSEQLLDRLFDTGSDLLVELLASDLPEPVEQLGEPTYAGKLGTDDLRIDWSRSAADIDRLIRAGRAWTTFRAHRLLIRGAEPVDDEVGGPGVVRGDLVGTGQGSIRLVSVQPEAKPSRSGAEWVNGTRVEDSERLV